MSAGGPLTPVEPAAGWERAVQVAPGADGTGSALVQVRHTLHSGLRDAYPVGARDLEIALTAGDAAGLAAAVAGLFAQDPDCRRIILAVPEGDEALASLAEAAALRPVVEVELADDSVVALWVAEPARVTAQSTAVDDLPQT